MLKKKTEIHSFENETIVLKSSSDNRIFNQPLENTNVSNYFQNFMLQFCSANIIGSMTRFMFKCVSYSSRQGGKIIVILRKQFCCLIYQQQMNQKNIILTRDNCSFKCVSRKFFRLKKTGGKLEYSFFFVVSSSLCGCKKSKLLACKKITSLLKFDQ